METGEGTDSQPSQTFIGRRLSAHRWHLQSFHHGRVALLVLFSFLYLQLQTEASDVAVEALVHSPEGNVRVEAGDLNVPATIEMSGSR
jgi:hypothetical protein